MRKGLGDLGGVGDGVDGVAGDGGEVMVVWGVGEVGGRQDNR